MTFKNAGVTADRPLPVPAAIAEYFPGSRPRRDGLLQPQLLLRHEPATTSMAQRYSDVVKWMAAIDLDQAYAPWLTSTGNLSANVEVDDNIIMD